MVSIEYTQKQAFYHYNAYNFGDTDNNNIPRRRSFQKLTAESWRAYMRDHSCIQYHSV